MSHLFLTCSSPVPGTRHTTPHKCPISASLGPFLGGISLILGRNTPFLTSISPVAHLSHLYLHCFSPVPGTQCTTSCRCPSSAPLDPVLAGFFLSFGRIFLGLGRINQNISHLYLTRPLPVSPVSGTRRTARPVLHPQVQFWVDFSHLLIEIFWVWGRINQFLTCPLPVSPSHLSQVCTIPHAQFCTHGSGFGWIFAVFWWKNSGFG